jgi:hypothetical protein
MLAFNSLLNLMRFVQQLKLVCSHRWYCPFPNPTIVLSIPETVPVNVGEAKFAFKI